MKVSVIISNRNDLEMLSITVRSCIEELSMIQDSEIVICDNSDQKYWDMLPSVIPQGYTREKKIRIIRQHAPCLFTARETAIRAAKGEYIFCVDGHMVIGHNCIRDLVNFMDAKNCSKIGFAHAPLCGRLHHHERQSKHDRKLERGELGPWGKQYFTAQKMTWKGMPWLCRRDWFLNELNGYGALSQHALAWGGGDMHIGTKPWLLGFENWAVPTRPCTHIGPFGKDLSKLTGYRYRVYAASGNDTNCLGFLVSSYVLGGEPMMERNKKALIKNFNLDVDKRWQDAIEYGKDERKWLLDNQVISYEDYLKEKPYVR